MRTVILKSKMPKCYWLLPIAFGLLLVASCGSSKHWIVELAPDQNDPRIASVVVSEVGDKGAVSKTARGLLQGVTLSKAVRIDCGDPKSLEAARATVLFVDRTVAPGRITLAVDGLTVDVLPARVEIRKGEAVLLGAAMVPSPK